MSQRIAATLLFALSPSVAAAELDRVYGEALPSILLVESENWTSVGFLADASGLIVTAPGAIQPVHYLAVTVAPGRRVAALPVDVPASPYGVIRVHPEAVSGLRPLSIAGPLDEASPGPNGEPLVAAFLSPAGGFVPRTGTIVEEDLGRIEVDLKFIGGSGHSAVPPGCWRRVANNVAPGVVLDTRGRVIGLNPFLAGLSNPRTMIARIANSEELLAVARAEAAKTSPPAPDPLPNPPARPYPEDVLERLAAGRPDLGPYQVLSGPFLVEFLTPVLARTHEVPIGGEGGQDPEEMCSRPKGDSNRWRPAFTDKSPVVTVRVIPEIRRRGGVYTGVTAFWIFSPAIFVSWLCSTVSSGSLTDLVPHVSFHFAPAIGEIELSRRGAKVEPIRAERVCGITGCLMNIELCPPEIEQRDARRLKGCYLSVTYPAEAFAPGEPTTLRLYREKAKKSDPAVVQLDDALLRRIQSDFQPYFDAPVGP